MNRKPASYVLAALEFLPVLATMKTFAISLVSSVCVMAALALPQTSSAQVPLVFQTTFGDTRYPTNNDGNPAGRTGTHWQQSDYFLNDYGANFTPGIGGTGSESVVQFGGGSYSSLGAGGNKPTGDDTILVAANNPNGAGGKGLRHWRGNGGTGQNDGGGGVRIGPPSPLGEFWFRMYMRYQQGFTWGPFGIANPGYTKDMRNQSGNGWVFGIQGGASWGISWIGANVTSSKSWQSTMGGIKGDGVFHCYEFHWQNGPGSHIEMWVDNALVLDVIRDTPTDQTGSIDLGDNQNAVGDSNGLSVNNGGTPTDWYTDYDDIAISTTGRVGCPIFASIAAPQNLRLR